jgi:hypothetical protein
LTAYIFPPASVTSSFQNNSANVAIKFGSREKARPFFKMAFFDQIVFLMSNDIKDVKEYQLRSSTVFASAVKYFRRTGRKVLPRVSNTDRLTKDHCHLRS